MESYNKENKGKYYTLLIDYQRTYYNLVKPVIDTFDPPNLFKLVFKKRINYDELLVKTNELYLQLVNTYSEMSLIAESIYKIGHEYTFTTPIIVDMARYNELFIEDVLKFGMLLKSCIDKGEKSELDSAFIEFYSCYLKRMKMIENIQSHILYGGF